MKKYRESNFISFEKHLYKTAWGSIAIYSSKFSRHDFTQPQHLAINCIKKRLRLTYREIIEVIDEMPRINSILGIEEKVPHFTIIQKFFGRVPALLFDRLLNQTLQLFDITEPWLAED